MPRILTAECKQEVSTFNPHLSRHDAFAVRSGEALLRYHRNVSNEVGGFLHVLDSRPDLEIVPALSAFSITSGVTLGAGDWQRLSTEILSAIRTAGVVEGVYFCMLESTGGVEMPVRRNLGEQFPKRREDRSGVAPFPKAWMDEIR